MGDGFDYDTLTTRNIGLVTGAEQTLRAAVVFVCGVGGMGRAGVMTPVRMRADTGRLICEGADG